MVGTFLAVALGFGALGVMLALGGLVANRVPLLAPPGLGERLRVYLTTHVAETAVGHRMPELEEPVIAVPPDVLYEAVRTAIDSLGWERDGGDPSQRRLGAVVTTRLWRFRDDVTVQVHAHGPGSRLSVRSASRVGRGDLGANTRHVLDLRVAVGKTLGERPAD
jgi:hypothetical protein